MLLNIGLSLASSASRVTRTFLADEAQLKKKQAEDYRQEVERHNPKPPEVT
jgi:hypothetical protein